MELFQFFLMVVGLKFKKYFLVLGKKLINTKKEKKEAWTLAQTLRPRPNKANNGLGEATDWRHRRDKEVKKVVRVVLRIGVVYKARDIAVCELGRKRKTKP